MNITCDARSLVGPHTGVATWLTEVVFGLTRRHGSAVTLAASKPIDLPDRLANIGVQSLPPPRLGIPGTLWLHTLLPYELARTGADVFLASLAVVPRRCRTPAVAMVHDITPRTHPLHHTVANRFCFNAYVEESLDRAAAVVVGSTATESELLEHFPFVRAKLTRIPYGIDGFFSPAPAGDDGATTRARFSAGRPYLLHLGTLEPRKGVRDLVVAYEILRASRPDSPDLVLAGGLGWGTGPILASVESSPARQHIHLAGYVERDQARELLRHAEVFVLASEAEGFGLPLGEAISCATPSVASDIPPLREAGGDAALFTAPGDPAKLAATIERALDPVTADQLRRRAVRRAAGLRWEPAVDAWHELLTRVARNARMDS
jgi:glycosyltransferase involved in cell wall biosynthesis